MIKNTPMIKNSEEVLYQLLDHFKTKAEMARQAKVSRNAVAAWFDRGRIGRIAARKFGRMATLPFTKEQLRPDIVNWTPMHKRK